MTEGYDNKAMDAAIARARAEVDSFVAVLVAKEGQSFAVKAPIKDPNGTEHFWLRGAIYFDAIF